jgi:predicted acyl esterase
MSYAFATQAIGQACLLPMLKVRKKETASMLTRDGVRLDADIYRPDVEDEFPVLLMRQLYGRAIAFGVASPIAFGAALTRCPADGLAFGTLR